MLNIFGGWKTTDKPGAVAGEPPVVENGSELSEKPTKGVMAAEEGGDQSSAAIDASDGHSPSENTTPTVGEDNVVSSVATGADATEGSSSAVEATEYPSRPDASKLPRFSFKSLGFIYGRHDMLSSSRERGMKDKAKAASKRASLMPLSRSDRRARETAVALQNVIVGPTPLTRASNATKSKATTKPQIDQIRSQLSQTKSANKVIAQLRQLPVPGALVSKEGAEGQAEWSRAGGAIHAVCLPQTEAELDANHFGKLANTDEDEEFQSSAPNVSNASLQGIVSFFSELRIVDFLNDPLGSNGILSGALPTAEAIADGFVKITPELMGLGYATGKAVQPNHAGIYPPLDRMSVITYWWGLEIPMPEPTMKYLDNTKSITHSFVNVLTALSILDAGVREILPFVRYISQFVDFEWGAIKKQDRGKGVVCAATWIMPAALVPRPWDFLDPPPPSPKSVAIGDGVIDVAPVETSQSNGGPTDALSSIPDGVAPVVGKSIDTVPGVVTGGDDKLAGSEPVDTSSAMPLPIAAVEAHSETTNAESS